MNYNGFKMIADLISVPVEKDREVFWIPERALSKMIMDQWVHEGVCFNRSPPDFFLLEKGFICYHQEKGKYVLTGKGVQTMRRTEELLKELGCGEHSATVPKESLKKWSKMIKDKD